MNYEEEINNLKTVNKRLAQANIDLGVWIGRIQSDVKTIKEEIKCLKEKKKPWWKKVLNRE